MNKILGEKFDIELFEKFDKNVTIGEILNHLKTYSKQLNRWKKPVSLYQT